MLQFAGVDLLTEDPYGVLPRELGRYQPLADLRLQSRATPLTQGRNEPRGPWERQVGIPVPNYPDPPELKLNTLCWPTGAARWAYFVGLVEYARLSDILDEITPITRVTHIDPDTSTTITADTTSATTAQLRIGDSLYSGSQIVDDYFNRDGPGRVLLSTAMYLLPPRPVSADLRGNSTSRSVRDKDDALWLVPLVDERWLWQFVNTGPDFGREWSEYRLYPDEYRFTWQDAFYELGVQIDHDSTGELGQVEVEDAYEAADPDQTEFCRAYESVSILLDAAAHCTGRRIIRNFDGTVEAQTASEADAEVTLNLTDPTRANGTRLMGESLDRPDPVWNGERTCLGEASVVPYAVKSVFRAYDEDEAYPVSRRAILFDQFITHPESLVIHNTSVVNGTGATWVDPHEALARQIAEDFYAWTRRRHDVVYAGVKEWHPTGFDDHLEISFGRRREDETYTAHTRVVSTPYNFGVSCMTHQAGHDLNDECFIETAEAFEAATHPFTSAASGLCYVYERTRSRPTIRTPSYVPQDFKKVAGLEVEMVSRWEEEIADGMPGRAKWRHKEWVIVAINCSAISASASSTS